MKVKEILRKRKELRKISGNAEFFFFSSALISAVALSLLSAFFGFGLMSQPSVEAWFSQSFAGSVQSALPLYEGLKNSSPFTMAYYELLRGGVEVLKEIISLLPFFIIVLFLVCPIYQGTLRWCAFVVEEGATLSLKAVFFYFTSARLYFGNILLSLRIFLRKAAFFVLFILPPCLCLFLSVILGSDYYGQYAISGASFILSLVWLSLSSVLYAVFVQRYAAVRYLYALGETERLFKKSCELTREKRAKFLKFKLLLSLNLLLVPFIITAPFSLSRIISANCLMVKELILSKNAAAV